MSNFGLFGMSGVSGTTVVKKSLPVPSDPNSHGSGGVPAPPSNNLPIYIDCGSSVDTVSTVNGGTYKADSFFVGGNTNVGDWGQDPVQRTERWTDVAQAIPQWIYSPTANPIIVTGGITRVAIKIWTGENYNTTNVRRVNYTIGGNFYQPIYGISPFAIGGARGVPVGLPVIVVDLLPGGKVPQISAVQDSTTLDVPNIMALEVLDGTGLSLTPVYVPPAVPTGAKPFAQVWSAYTEAGAGGQHIRDTFLTFEAFVDNAHPLHSSINMADIVSDNMEGSIYSQFNTVSPIAGYNVWAPGNQVSHKFVLFWPSSWHSGGSRTSDQDLLAAITDQLHIDIINNLCTKYLKPVFGNGANLWIRLPHEWELNYYPWGLTRSANNTPDRLITQSIRQANAFRAQMPNVGIVACSIAGAGSPARYQVLNGIKSVLTAVTADIYDTGDMASQYADIKTLFDWATSNGLKVGISETGIQSRGDNGQFIRDLWTNIKGYDQAIDHVAWFDSSQGGASRYLESNPNSLAAVRDLILNF